MKSSGYETTCPQGCRNTEMMNQAGGQELTGSLVDTEWNIDRRKAGQHKPISVDYENLSVSERAIPAAWPPNRSKKSLMQNSGSDRIHPQKA